jgi:phospholipid/cholesterol/gamma-HCH transport system substrate-binding protein
MVLGAALLGVFAVALFVALDAANGLPGTSGTVVKATFSSVEGLDPGNDVRIAGIRVGRVSKIGLSRGHAVVTIVLDTSRPVFRNASAAIADQSALGEEYVQLNPGTASAGTLAAGGVIPENRTTASQSLYDLLQALNAPTRSALGSSVRQVGGGLASHVQDLHSAGSALPAELPDLGAVSRALSANSGADTTQLLQAANSLAGSLNGRQQQIASLLDKLNKTFGAIDVNNGKPLGSAIDQAPTALSKTREALDSLQSPLGNAQQALTSLRPGAASLGTATPDLRASLEEGVSPMRRLSGVAEQAVPAVTSLTTTFRDARPVAPLLSQALGTATHPLAVIAPYAPDISLFFTYFSGALEDGDAAGHWLRIYPPIDTQSVTGLLPTQDPFAAYDAYAPPGEAYNERQTSLIGTKAGGGR